MLKETIDLMIEPNHGREMKDIAKELGVKVHDTFWITIDLNSIDTIKKLIDFSTQGHISLVQGVFSQELENFDTEWYCLKADKLFAWDSFDKYPSCKAYRIPKGLHLTDLYGSTYVSEKFRGIVESNNLTGLKFLWIKDTGRYKAPQWFLVVAEEPLGRGIDHEWFNSVPKGGGSWQPTNEFRNGIWAFENDQVDGNTFNNDRYKLLSLFKPGKLHIRNHLTYLKKHLPDKDFAFFWIDEDRANRTNSYGGEIARKSRKVCINKRAKDILIKNGLISENNISAIKLLDEVPNGKEYLDLIKPLPKPFFFDQWEVVKNEEKELLKIFNSKPKLEKSISFPEAIKQLKKSIKDRSKDFANGANKKDIESIEVFHLPSNWIEVLNLTNGGILSPDLECQIVDIIHLYEFNEQTNDWYKELEEEKPKNFFHICYSPSGDFYSLDLDSSDGIDSKVVLTSHETLEAERTWETIGIFLDDMLNQV